MNNLENKGRQPKYISVRKSSVYFTSCLGIKVNVPTVKFHLFKSWT